MKSKINQILKDIENKKKELFKEYLKIKEKYGFSNYKGNIIFDKKFIEYNKKFKEGLLKYIFTSQFRNILSTPFIYSMIIPGIILDIFVTMYTNIAFRLYGIELVKRKDYFNYDRRHLDYLNLFEKFNCLYCSYINGLMSYCTEAAGRTEKYWCPIKHSKKMKAMHSSLVEFADYGDAEGFRDIYNNTRSDIKK